MPRYIFRLDDICPTMNWKKFRKIEKIFDRYKVKPIVGIVPDNLDANLIVDKANKDFWKEMKLLVNKGWIVAQHGYQHKYINEDSGMLKITNHSEFSGLSYKDQYDKILKGKNILEKQLGIKIEWWMAPSHSFDRTTCKVLCDLGFRYITDGIALYPYRKYGLLWIPQQLWKPERKLFGVWTICIHLNNVDDAYLESCIKLLKFKYYASIEAVSEVKGKEFIDNLFRLYWCAKYVLFDMLLKVRRLYRIYIRYNLLRFKENLSGLDITKYNSVEEIGLSRETSNHYSSSGNNDLKRIIEYLKVSRYDSILDFGCGKGGAMIVFSGFPFCKVDGVELSELLSSIAIKNFNLLGLTNLRVICADAKNFTNLDQYNYFYFYNPFPAGVMSQVLVNIQRSVVNSPRQVTLIYKNPVLHEMFMSCGFLSKIREFVCEDGLTLCIYRSTDS